jgi:hypothetical protein
LLQIRFDETKVILIANDDIGLTHGIKHGGSHVFRAARTKACYDDFGHWRFVGLRLLD